MFQGVASIAVKKSVSGIVKDVRRESVSGVLVLVLVLLLLLLVGNMIVIGVNLEVSRKPVSERRTETGTGIGTNRVIELVNLTGEIEIEIEIGSEAANGTETVAETEIGKDIESATVVSVIGTETEIARVTGAETGIEETAVAAAMTAETIAAMTAETIAAMTAETIAAMTGETIAAMIGEMTGEMSERTIERMNDEMSEETIEKMTDATTDAMIEEIEMIARTTDEMTAAMTDDEETETVVETEAMPVGIGILCRLIDTFQVVDAVLQCLTPQHQYDILQPTVKPRTTPGRLITIELIDLMAGGKNGPIPCTCTCA